jgi:hypothetical protein
MGWSCLEYIMLNEEETTSSSRIFIKILFQEISEYLGLPKLKVWHSVVIAEVIIANMYVW